MIELNCRLTCIHCGQQGTAYLPIAFTYADGCYSVLAADVHGDRLKSELWQIVDGNVMCAALESCARQAEKLSASQDGGGTP